MQCQSCGYQYPEQVMTTTLENIDGEVISVNLCPECYIHNQRYRSD